MNSKQNDGKSTPNGQGASSQMSRPDGTPDDAWQLFCAATDGDLLTARRLIEGKPKLMHHQIWYEFPIHYAVRAGHAEIVQLLLNAGSNPARSNFTYSSWQKLLPMAQERGREDIHQLLVAVMQRRFNYDPDYKPLWTAIVENRVAKARKLIADNPRLVNVGDEHGNRAIHWAVLARQIPITQVLLAAGADINAKRADLQSPLHLSIEGDYWFRKTNHKSDVAADEVTNFLLKNGADYEFSAAVALGDVDHVKAELKNDPGLAKCLNDSQRSPLYHAARRGHVELVRLLLDHGANPNLAEVCADRGAALFEASSRIDIEMMTLLLKHGADANAYVDSCGNCLSIAANGSDQAEEAINVLRQCGAQDGEWVVNTPEKIAERLADDSFQLGIDPWSGIINSILKLDSIELLDKFIARFSTQPIRELNPTNGWRVPRSETMLAELLRHGMDINARDWFGKSFLHHVANDESTDRADWLIDHGIDIDAIDRQSGTTALGLAASVGNLRLVECLLARGANPSLPLDTEWARPISLAKKAGHDSIQQRLQQV